MFVCIQQEGCGLLIRFFKSTHNHCTFSFKLLQAFTGLVQAGIPEAMASHFIELGKAINSGKLTAISTDLDGNNRTNIPDIGAFETTF